ncbi:MAG: hypothetical protein GTO02_16650 [Candidatus Dadabacteria bacterium]|nr:hypothetical protein [Candidatus Aenigmarchaeota archaeon]NIQ15957.1 hypothetical protein [Candidatus Dadabacteria bacterium]
MSDKSCDCKNITLGNTGKPDCANIADVAAYLILDMAKDSSGAPKERDAADLLTFAGLEPLLNAASPLDRLYPLGKFENVEHNREDDVFWTANSGKQAFVREGFKNFSGMLINAPRELVGLLNANNCKNFGFHIIDDSNQLISKKGSTAAKCKPILIDNDTFRAKYVEATNDAPAMIMLSFQWKSTEKDQNIKVATGLDYTGEDLYGLLNADALYSAIAVDSVVATITTTDYGHAVEGLQLADFSLEEVSPTPGAIAISGVSETSAGVYTISFAAQTSGDVLRLSASKDRFDFSAMSDGTNDILIP